MFTVPSLRPMKLIKLNYIIIYYVGGACSHNKVFGLSLFPHQREFCTERLVCTQHYSDYIHNTLLSTPAIA